MIKITLKTAFIAALLVVGLVGLTGTCVVIGIQSLGDPGADGQVDTYMVGKQPRLVIIDRSHLTTTIVIEKGRAGVMQISASSYGTLLKSAPGYMISQDADTVKIETKPTELRLRLNPLQNPNVRMWITVPEETILDVKSDHAKVIMH